MWVRTHDCKNSGFQTQATKPLDHQNCKWLPVLSFLACFTGKTGELRERSFCQALVTKLEKIRCTYFGPKTFWGCWTLTIFLVTWGVICTLFPLHAEGNDYSGMQNASVFTPNEEPKACVSVPILNDELDEDSETFSVVAIMDETVVASATITITADSEGIHVTIGIT